MKKIPLLLLAALLLTAGSGSAMARSHTGNHVVAASLLRVTLPLRLELNEPIDVTAAPMSTSNFSRRFALDFPQTGSSATFAELNSDRKSPISSTCAIGLILAVLAFRVFGLTRARELADREKQTHYARKQMYRSLLDQSQESA